MPRELTTDEVLLSRLPLPLAQLYCRAVNAKTPVDRHHHAYYLGEATLKLAATARIGIALGSGLPADSTVATSLVQLCLPSVGHWIGFLRDIAEHLRQRPDADLLPLSGSHAALFLDGALSLVQPFADRISQDTPNEPAILPREAV